MTTHNVDLGYRPRVWQQKLHSGKKRFTIAIVHRRGGKSFAAAHELAHEALLAKRHLGYIAETLGQARRVMWPLLKEIGHKIPGAILREVEMTVEMPNGSVIRCMGADAYDSIRGMGFDGAVCDEFQLWDKEVLPSVVMPTLANRMDGQGGWLLLIGTPTGIDPLTTKYDKALADPAWAAFKFNVYDTGVLNPSEIEVQKAECVGNSFRLEWLCDFDAGSHSQLITGDVVNVATSRSLLQEHYEHSARVMGCDIARQGDDRSVICRRQGFQCWDFEDWQNGDLMYTTRKIKEAYYAFKPDGLFIDGGGIGAGVVDALRDMDVPVIEVQFGAKASDPRFLNLRAEMWFALANWLVRGGRLPHDVDLKMELTAPIYKQNDKGQLQLESKEDLKKRGMQSPDKADALALTFAMPVHPKSAEADQKPVHDWDPFRT